MTGDAFDGELASPRADVDALGSGRTHLGRAVGLELAIVGPDRVGSHYRGQADDRNLQQFRHFRFSLWGTRILGLDAAREQTV